MENEKVIFLSKGKDDEALVFSTDGKSTECLSPIPIGNQALYNWLNKFERTMSNITLVFDENSCKRESLLLGEELNEILKKYHLED